MGTRIVQLLFKFYGSSIGKAEVYLVRIQAGHQCDEDHKLKGRGRRRAEDETHEDRKGEWTVDGFTAVREDFQR
jgi:hypothetical protein